MVIKEPRSNGARLPTLKIRYVQELFRLRFKLSVGKQLDHKLFRKPGGDP